jgi:hypothetical protein
MTFSACAASSLTSALVRQHHEVLVISGTRNRPLAAGVAPARKMVAFAFDQGKQDTRQP